MINHYSLINFHFASQEDIFQGGPQCENACCSPSGLPPSCLPRLHRRRSKLSNWTTGFTKRASNRFFCPSVRATPDVTPATHLERVRGTHRPRCVLNCFRQEPRSGTKNNHVR